MMRPVCNEKVLKQNINNSPYDNLSKFALRIFRCIFLVDTIT